MGNTIPPAFIPGCEKGFKEAANSGTLIGHPVEVFVRSCGHYNTIEAIGALLNILQNHLSVLSHQETSLYANQCFSVVFLGVQYFAHN